MADDPPVLDFFPSRFDISQTYGKDINDFSPDLPIESLHPFELIAVNAEGIVVAPGVINNHYAGPAGIIDHTAGTSLDYLVLDVTAGQNGISAAEIKVNSSAPSGFAWSENSAPGNFEVLLAVFDNTQKWQIVRNNLYADVRTAHTNIKQNISIGEYDSDVYYQWRIAAV